MADNVGETQLLRKPLKDINLGTHDNLHIAFMDTLVIDVIHKMFDYGISSVPILSDEGGRPQAYEVCDGSKLIGA